MTIQENHNLYPKPQKKLKDPCNDAIMLNRYCTQYARRLERNANTNATGLQGISATEGLLVPELVAHIFVCPAETRRIIIPNTSIEPDYTDNTINIDGSERTTSCVYGRVLS